MCVFNYGKADSGHSTLRDHNDVDSDPEGINDDDIRRSSSSRRRHRRRDDYAPKVEVKNSLLSIVMLNVILMKNKM